MKIISEVIEIVMCSTNETEVAAAISKILFTATDECLPFNMILLSELRKNKVEFRVGFMEDGIAFMEISCPNRGQMFIFDKFHTVIVQNQHYDIIESMWLDNYQMMVGDEDEFSTVYTTHGVKKIVDTSLDESEIIKAISKSVFTNDTNKPYDKNVLFELRKSDPDIITGIGEEYDYIDIYCKAIGKRIVVLNK